MSNQPAKLAAEARSRAISSRTQAFGVDTAVWTYLAENKNAPTVLLVHGYRGNHHGLESFAGALKDFNLIIPDLPGFGESGELEQAHNIANYGSWLTDLVRSLKLKSPIVLGHSFGTIVTCAAVAGGADASRVILVNPVSAPALEGPRAGLTILTRAVHRLTAIVPEFLGNFILRSFLFVRTMSVVLAKTKDPNLRSWIHSQHDANFNNYTSRKVAVEGYYASISHTVGDYARQIRQPTLLVAGEKDDITSVADQKKVQRIFPNAKLVVIPGVGHLTHYEKPIEVAQEIRNFINLSEG